MKMIISIAGKTYLDMKYNESTPYGLDWAGYIPVETAYNWDPTDFAPKDLVLGIEAPLWTETISTQDQMDYMIYPRLLGYAEIGWTPKENRDWNEYKVRLEKQGSSVLICVWGGGGGLNCFFSSICNGNGFSCIGGTSAKDTEISAPRRQLLGWEPKGSISVGDPGMFLNSPQSGGCLWSC